MVSLAFTHLPYLYGLADFCHNYHGLSCLLWLLTLLTFVGSTSTGMW
jgi:hypothetical protein